MKSFTRFFSKNRKGEGDRVPFSHSAECEISYDTKDQEGRPNSPVDCLAVGNPIKGFPENNGLESTVPNNSLDCLAENASGTVGRLTPFDKSQAWIFQTFFCAFYLGDFVFCGKRPRALPSGHPPPFEKGGRKLLIFLSGNVVRQSGKLP